MAVDLPGLDAADLKNLVEFHHTRQTLGATAFAAYQEAVTGYSPVPMAEPLCSIWTREAKVVFLTHFQLGLSARLQSSRRWDVRSFFPGHQTL
jgi:hypothetical protein